MWSEPKRPVAARLPLSSLAEVIERNRLPMSDRHRKSVHFAVSKNLLAGEFADGSSIVANLEFLVGTPKVAVVKIDRIGGAVNILADEADGSIRHQELRTTGMLARERPPGDRSHSPSARGR